MWACAMRVTAHLPWVVASTALVVTLIVTSVTALPVQPLPPTPSTTVPLPVVVNLTTLPRGQGDDDDYVRPDDRLRRRDFVWKTTQKAPQNLCGPSTFSNDVDRVDGSSSNGNSNDQVVGPSVEDCTMFVHYATTIDGFWLVNNFGGGGGGGGNNNWIEFSRLQTCKVAVRHSDGGHGTIPIGNQDVIDLLNSVMALHPGAETLPPTEGNMTCKRRSSSAVAEWRVYSSQATQKWRRGAAAAAAASSSSSCLHTMLLSATATIAAAAMGWF